jgi:hypothetical protein
VINPINKRAVYFLLILLQSWCIVSVRASDDTLYAAALRYAQAGSYDTALEIIGRILQANTLSSDALLLKGRVYFLKKNYPEACGILEKVVVLSPGNRDAWVGLITALHEGNEHMKACSTLYRAFERFSEDSVLFSLHKKVCWYGQQGDSSKVKKTTGTTIESFVGAGITAFEKSYNRYPWANLESGIDLKRPRWGLQTIIHTQRRKYGELTLYGAEIEVAPRYAILPELSATLRLSFSPYSIFDTMYSSNAINVELHGDVPDGIEVDGSARLRWYGERFSPSYMAGIGKSLGHNFLSTRLFVATLGERALFTGTAELRRYSGNREKVFGLIGAAIGRSPYDAGALIKKGYLSFYEMTIGARPAMAEKLWVMPMLSVAGEQLNQRDDFNGDGTTDLKISDVRMRVSIMMTLFFERGP